MANYLIFESKYVQLRSINLPPLQQPKADALKFIILLCLTPDDFTRQIS